MNKVGVGYVRVSSTNQSEESLDAQERLITECAKKEGIILKKFYRDYAKSGCTSAKRTEFLQMIEDAKSGAFQYILVHKLDRFSRNRYESLHYKYQLKKYKVSVMSVLEKLDSSPESIILESVLEAINEFYSRNLAREVLKGFTQRALEAKHLGGKPPLGFAVDRETMKYVVNEEEAVVVRKIFAMYQDGCGYGKIIAYLNSQGHRTRWKKLYGKTAIYQILRNEKYRGVYNFNRAPSKDALGKRTVQKTPEDIIRIPDGLPRIISDEDFLKVQEKLAAERKRPGAYKAKSVFLLSGLVKCGCCQSTYQANSRLSGRNRKRYFTYRCSLRAKDRTACDNKEVNRDYLDDFILSELKRVVFSERRIPALVRRLNEFQAKLRETNTQESVEVKREITKIDAQIQNILDAVANGMNHATLKERLSCLEEEKIGLEMRVKEIEFVQSRPYIDEETLKAVLHRYGNFIETRQIPECKKFVREFVDQVVIHKDHVDVKLKVNIGKHGSSESIMIPNIRNEDFITKYRHNVAAIEEARPA